MSTRSSITVELAANEYKSIYCHFDGGLSYVGRILKEHYSTIERANDLMDLGDLSSLGNELAPPDRAHHSYRAPFPDVTIAYGRDRMESGTEAKEYESLDQIELLDYNYLFKDGEWFLIKDDRSLEGF